MPITPRNILRHELIGLFVEIVEAKNKTQLGMKGLVVNETKNTLWIETEKGVKKVLKKDCKFMFTLPSGKKVVVEGKLLAKRPEERIKMRVKRW